MLKQVLWKRAKILRGAYRTYLRRHETPYLSHLWWDAEFYNKGVSDRQTISADKDVLSASYHYASIELLILRHLCNTGFDCRSAAVCDLGTGAGHWIDFYRSIGAGWCFGIDISEKALEFLERKYAGRKGIEMLYGKFHEVLDGRRQEFDLINAIGVMFHVVDDSEWQRSLRSIAGALRPGGLFVVSGHFGLLNKVNVQFDGGNSVNKRLRSGGYWRRCLEEVGFEGITIYRNRAYIFVDDSLPENNVLVARKKARADT